MLTDSLDKSLNHCNCNAKRIHERPAYRTTPTPTAECRGGGLGQQDGAHDLGFAGP